MGYSVPPIPEPLRDNLAYGLGEAEAERWLAGAVARAGELFVSWELRPEQVLAGGSESLCVKCEAADGSDTVLKLPANPDGGAAETAALRAWAGDGAARVLRDDPALGAMLMNFLGWVGEGSYTLAEVLDLADRLHDGPTDNHAYPSVEGNVARRVRWASQRFAEIEDDRAGLDVLAAEKLMAELMSVDQPLVLLHGDFQPKNLIVSDEGLTVVDPLPAVGPEIFDLALWVVKCGEDHPLDQCVSELVELRPAVDVDLLRRCSWAFAVLESRPYLGAGNAHREHFIETHRDLV